MPEPESVETPAVPNFLLFLDFDGVVKHPKTNSLEEDPVRCVRALASRLHAGIVLSSSWRSVVELDRLNPLFDGRILGATPTLDGPEAQEDYARHREVLAFLEARGWQSVPWLALDDDPLNYPQGAPVHLTNPETLLTREEVEAIVGEYGPPQA